MANTTPPANIYPTLKITRIENPSRFYAVPIIGIFVKFIMLIPVFLEMIFLGLLSLFYLIANSFAVLLTGKYWDSAYTFQLGLMRFQTKITFFMQGLTNTYPGFDFTITDGYSLDIAKPENPNRLFAIPLFGGIARVILLIPYFIFDSVIGRAASIGVFCSFFRVLVYGKYPDSTFELARDSMRINMAAGAYMMGLSDKYPNFWISMNHQTIKIILIILGALSVLGNGTSSMGRDYNDNNNYNYEDLQQQ